MSVNTKVLRHVDGTTFESTVKYGDLIRDLPCIYVNHDGLKGCVVRKSKIHQTIGDDTTVDIYGLDLQFRPVPPHEFQRSGASWRQGDFFFSTPPCVYMVYQLERINDTEVTMELSLHAFDASSYGVARYRNRTVLYRDRLMERMQLDGITRVIFR